MKGFRLLLTLCFVVALGMTQSISFSQPTIPKEDIPSDAPHEVREQIKRLYSSSAVERARAALSLGSKGFRAEAAVPFLVSLLSDSSRIERQRLPGRIERISVSDVAAEALVSIGKLSVHSLLGGLDNQNSDVRRKAAWTLGEIGDKRALSPLIALLKDESWRVRGKAVEALGKLRNNEATDAIRAALKDSEGWVRKEALIALGKLEFSKTPTYETVLLESLQDKFWEVRVVATSKLGEMKIVTAVVPLIGALKDDTPGWAGFVRAAAATALGKIGDRRAVDPLIELLKNSHHAARKAAAEALGNIGDIRAVAPLIESLSYKLPPLSSHEPAVKALTQITGNDFGQDANKWQQWWEQNKSKLQKSR